MATAYFFMSWVDRYLFAVYIPFDAVLAYHGKENIGKPFQKLISI